MPLISLFCLWNCFLLLPWLIGHLASSKKTNGNVWECKDILYTSWPVPMNISYITYTIYLSLSMCPECTDSLACVETVFFFLSLWVLVSDFQQWTWVIFNLPPHYATCYLSTESLADHWRSVTVWRPFYWQYWNLLTHLCPTSQIPFVKTGTCVGPSSQ